METNPKVFISYSHQDEQYEAKVLQFTNRLRRDGIDADIDLYNEAPSEGWPRWMENQIHNSDFVIVINSKSYFEKFYTHDGKGINWEANILYQVLYDNTTLNANIIPVFFNQDEVQYILTPLKPYTYYDIGTDSGYEKLYWRLRGVNRVSKPPLGKLKPLPEKEQKTMFYSSPIELEKWDKAKWRGMVYLFEPDRLPILGLLFEDYSVSKEVFAEWQRRSEREPYDSFLKIDFIIPPFPNKSWIYSDPDSNYGKGYFVHIGPNVEATITNAQSMGYKADDYFIGTISRCRWVNEISGSKNRDYFMNLVSKNPNYYLAPIGIKDKLQGININNIVIEPEYFLPMHTIGVKKGNALHHNDICNVVLNKQR